MYYLLVRMTLCYPDPYTLVLDIVWYKGSRLADLLYVYAMDLGFEEIVIASRLPLLYLV